MFEQHLEYDIRFKITVCTNKDKRQLVASLDAYIESMPDCFVCCKDWNVDNVRLCDCSALEDKLQEQSENEECE